MNKDKKRKSILGFYFTGDIKKGEIAEAWSKNLIPEFEEVCLISPFLHDVKVFLDVGANTGLYSLVFASRGDFNANKKIFAFEPQKLQAKILHDTVIENNWQHQFLVHQIGLSDVNDVVWINNGSDVSTGASLVKSLDAHGVELVKLTTLDYFCAENQVPSIDLIKIDVEGHEFELLMGGKQTIEQYKPLIFIELSPCTKSVKETTDFLISQGYQMYRLDNGLIVKYSDAQTLDHVTMIICISTRFSYLIGCIAGKNISSLCWNVFLDSSLKWPFKYLKYWQFQARWKITKIWHKVRLNLLIDHSPS